MFWVLLTAVLLLCLLALGLTLLTLWRRVRALGGQVSAVSTTVAEAQQAMEASKVGGPLEIRPCPTCGAPARAGTLRSAGVLP